MKFKSIIFILGISIIACRLFSQSAGNKNAYQIRISKVNKSKVSMAKSAGLGYFSDPSENLLDFYHYSLFPDSIYGYDHDTQAGIWLNIRSYYTVNNNSLQAKNYSDIYYTTGDVYYYNKTGLLDSAILESEADREYDEYAIKHIYSYSGSLIDSEVVAIDNIDDSVSDDWAIVQEIKYEYDNDNRIKEKSIHHLNWLPDQQFENTFFYYHDSSGDGITRIDTTFVTISSGDLVPNYISINKLNTKNQSTKIQNFEFANYYYLKSDSFGTPDSVNKIDIEYDTDGNLLSELISSYNGSQPDIMKNLYSYYSDGMRKSKTIYDIVNKNWNITYQYNYYYKSQVTKITDTENKAFRIFPNPVNDVLHIQGVSIGAEVNILTVDGKIVRKQKYDNSAILVSDLPQGVYMLVINIGKSHKLKSFFIKK